MQKRKIEAQLGDTFEAIYNSPNAHPHMDQIYQESTQYFNLSMSSMHFVNGTPQGSLLPFSLCGVSLNTNGVADVWEGGQRESFDSGQEPFGIKWQSIVEASAVFGKFGF